MYIANTPIISVTLNNREHGFAQTKLKTKLRGLSPRANYTDRAAAAVRRS